MKRRDRETHHNIVVSFDGEKTVIATVDGEPVALPPMEQSIEEAFMFVRTSDGVEIRFPLWRRG